MKSVGTGKIKLKDIKHIENSRIREKDDVSDLMKDIQERGLLEPVGVRKSDNALIFGNRRVKAYEKLEYDQIECIFFDDVSDEDLLITNVIENIKRKNIGSIEIGRIVNILMEKGLTLSEISVKLGITKGRVSSSHSCFKVAKNTPFEKLITFGTYGKASTRKGIPENLVWRIQQQLTKIPNFKLSKEDWKLLLSEAEKGEISGKNITLLRGIFLTNPRISLIRALEVLKKSKIVYSHLAVNKEVLAKCISKEKASNDLDLIRIIIKKYNPDLLF